MDGNVETDLMSLWQKQAREEPLVRLDDVRTKAERLDRRTRRSHALGVLLFIFIVSWEAWQVWTGDEVLERAGDLLTIAAFVYIAYRFRRYRLTAPPVALGNTNCLDFYRAELVRQRDLSKDSWGYLLPFVPGVALALIGNPLDGRPASHIAALITSGVGLFLGIAWWNERAARKIQEEIDLL